MDTKKKQAQRRSAIGGILALCNILIPVVSFLWVMVIKSFYSENLLNVVQDTPILYFFDGLSFVILAYTGFIAIIFLVTFAGYDTLLINRFLVYVSCVVFFILTLIIYIKKYHVKLHDLLIKLDTTPWYQSLDSTDQKSVKRLLSNMRQFFIFILVACIVQGLYAAYVTYLFKKCACV